MGWLTFFPLHTGNHRASTQTLVAGGGGGEQDDGPSYSEKAFHQEMVAKYFSDSVASMSYVISNLIFRIL